MNRMRVHSQKERLQVRLTGERQAQRALVQLIAAASILRTALTRLLSLAGCSAWWLTLICLLPGFALTALLSLGMRLTGAATLTELARYCLGKNGGWLVSMVVGLLLLLDGTSALTALITLFTEGLGTSGTQLTMAILTGSALLFALHREGLPRVVLLLRWVMLAAALLTAALGLPAMRVDHLYPLLGDGETALMAAFRAGLSLSWPLALLLTVPAEAKRPAVAQICPVVLAVVAVLLFVGLTHPQEQLVHHQGLAECLMLTAPQGSPAIRLMAHCLLMLVLFLAVAGAVQLSAESLSAPWSMPQRWLPFVLLAGLTATQAIDPGWLWHTLALAEPWLLLPFAVITTISLPIAIIRRKRT